MDLEEFLCGYVECALWAETALGAPDMIENDDTSFTNAGYDADDISEETFAGMKEDCAQFVEANAADLAIYEELSGRPAGHAGHDFWLSRNSHGAGFFDRGREPVFDRLQDAARAYGAIDLFVVDGRICA